MTTKQMEYILELSHTRNFNRAAENLFITQPALTYQIQRAEEEIGFTLFVRSGRGAALTIAGERFVETVEKLLASYNEAVAVGRKLDPLFSAAITVALPARFALPGLAECIAQFEESHDKIPVMPRYYTQSQSSDMPDADVLFVAKDVHNIRRKGWRERMTVMGYRGEDSVPRIGESDGQGGGTIWIPYASEAVDTAVMLRQDEQRQAVLDFFELFKGMHA